MIQVKVGARIENPRKYAPHAVERLRHLLTVGIPAQRDPRGENSYKIEGKMDMQIETGLNGELLHVNFTGRVDLDSAMRLYKEVCDLAAEKQLHKILINSLGLSGTLSTFERYEVGSKIAEYFAELGIHAKLACVGVPPTVDGFVARVAQNRDVAMEVFPTHDRALEWLGR